MRKIVINKKEYNPPTSFNELSYSQYEKILGIVEGSTDVHAIKRAATLVLLGLKKSFWIKLERSWMRAAKDQATARAAFHADALNLCQIADFLFKEIEVKGKKYLVKAETRTQPPFKRYRHRYSPSAALGNITFIEWALLDTFYTQYQKKPTAQLYHKIIALLYRPMRTDTQNNIIDPRRTLPLYYPAIDRHSATVAKWTTSRKRTIFHFFISCRQALVKRYPNSFQTGAPNADAKPINYAHLMTDIAGEKFGTVEQCQAANIHTVLTYLDLNAQRQAEKKFNEQLDSLTK